MGVLSSFGHAIRGILHVLKKERNARLHLVAAFAAFGLGLLLEVSNVELAAIFFASILVFIAEVFNTAIEKTLDIIQTEHHPQIKIIKDMSAGAVMIAAIAAVMIGVVIFLPRILMLWL
jgi:diacylglycerol kinase